MTIIEQTTGRRVSAMLVHSDGATGKRTALFPDEGLRVPLDDDAKPDPTVELNDLQRSHIEDYRGFRLGAEATVSGDRVVTLPDGSEWPMDEEWQPLDWPRPPDRAEAHGIYKAVQDERIRLDLPRRAFNPDAYMAHGKRRRGGDA